MQLTAPGYQEGVLLVRLSNSQGDVSFLVLSQALP
jgi:hypothetical protein